MILLLAKQQKQSNKMKRYRGPPLDHQGVFKGKKIKTMQKNANLF